MPTVPQEPTTEPSGSGTNTGAIVGGIIGGLVAVAMISGAAFYFGKNKSSGKFSRFFDTLKSPLCFYSTKNCEKLTAPLVPTLSVRNPSIVPAGVEMADEENMEHDYMGQSNPMYDNG